MARETDQSHPVTGRTPWDALVEISNRFAPPLLIVAVVAWALYEYRKSDRDYMAKLEEARAQTSEDYKNELNQLHDALIKTYQTMQSITDARIEKFGTMLDLGDQVVARTAELSKKEQDQQKLIDESERQLEVTQEQLVKRQADLDNLEKILEASQKDLNTCNVATIALSDESVSVPSDESVSAPTPMGAWVLGSLSARYETSGRGPGMMSSGIGDPSGVVYGSYQMTSRPNGGTVARFVTDASFPWRDRFASLQPGSPEFSAEWRALASEAPEAFFQAQHDFVKQTHYDPLVRKIKDEDGVDIDNRSRTLQDVVWSTAVQHGPNTPIVHRALTQLQADGVLSPDDADFDETLIKAIYSERSRNSADGNLVYFARNSAAVQEGVRRRFQNELQNAVAALKSERKHPG